MRKFLCWLTLFVAVGTLISASPMAPAEQKKDEPGKIEVYEAKDGWRFRIINEDGKAVAIGTVGYDKKEDCLKVVDFVKLTMAKGKVTEVKKEKDKK